MGKLDGKIAVVTGGSGLLGSTFVDQISQVGGIAINVDISCEKDLENNQYQCDITSENSVKETIDAIVEKHGKIDGWINNAYPKTDDWGKKLEDIPFNSWRKNVDMHLNGYFNCSRQICEQMKKQQSGSVVNMASIYGILGPNFNIYQGTEMTMPVAYSAIKGAIVNFTRYLASYYGPHKVRANCISPGGIFDQQPKSFVTKYTENVPLGRMGNTDDISPAVEFLLSDDSKYITGHNLVIDGGWSCI
ncbi:MAG: short-chain dehydrogenase [Flavobacteriales bacterium]|nr:MAG: short-chain dehydrogenase [Flavobacteriales bacterium]